MKLYWKGNKRKSNKKFPYISKCIGGEKGEDYCYIENIRLLLIDTNK
jgi:hypothetical protein